MDVRTSDVLTNFVEGEISPSALINLWTIQQPGAVELLNKTGKLTGDPKFAFKTEFDKPGKRTAFRWMNEQMQKRGLIISDNAVPIWAFLLPPVINEFWEHREGDHLIQLKVPLIKVLISIHGAWSKFLNVSESYHAEFLSINEADRQRQNSRNNLTPDCQTCRLSWEKMFDLTLIKSPGFSLPTTFQATLSEVFIDDILHIEGPPLNTQEM